MTPPYHFAATRNLRAPRTKGFPLLGTLSPQVTDEGAPCGHVPLIRRVPRHLLPKGKGFPVIQKRSRCFAQRLLFLVFGSGYSFGSRCAFSSAGRSARYKSTAHTVDSSELTSVTPLAILVTTEAISAG